MCTTKKKRDIKSTKLYKRPFSVDFHFLAVVYATKLYVHTHNQSTKNLTWTVILPKQGCVLNTIEAHLAFRSLDAEN